MKYLIGFMFAICAITTGSAQLQFITNNQIPGWFPYRFPGTDSIGVIEQNGQNGGTFELLLVYPDTLFQVCRVTYDNTSKQSSATKDRVRDAEYLRNQIMSKKNEIDARHERDSVFLRRYFGVYQYLTDFITTPPSPPPADTTGN